MDDLTLLMGISKVLTAFFDNNLKLHRTKLEGADAFYDKHVGSLLIPPRPKDLADFPKLVRHEFTVKDKTDIVFSGLGWIRVQGKADQPTIVCRLGTRRRWRRRTKSGLFKT